MSYLMIHQKEGYEFLSTHNRCLLADEAGLGKSRQVLEAAKQFVHGRNMLVLCPTSIVENWKIERAKWGFPENKFVCVGYEYEFLHSFKQLKARKWGVIVADECHMLRNWGAQRTKLFKQLIKGRDSKIWLLSGTPMVKGAMDLHPILSFIQPGVWGKYKEFCDEHCRTRDNQWKPGGKEYYGVLKPKVLSTALEQIMIRRFKKDVLPDLPSKLFSRIPVLVDGSGFDIFTDAGIVRAVLRGVETSGGSIPDTEVIETMRDLGLRKVNHVIKFIEDTLLPHPLVIFAHHRMVLYDIAEKLRDKGRKVEVIIGGMDKGVRQRYVEDFQNGKIDDLVCSITVAGVGINLFRSSRCVFAEYPWTWAALEQACDRLHRIGQHDSVNVYMCYAKGTFEEAQLNAIEERKTMTREVVGVK